MATRKELFQRPGPYTHEANFLLTVEQLNLLRKRAGYPEKTVHEWMDLLANHQSHLRPYTEPET